MASMTILQIEYLIKQITHKDHWLCLDLDGCTEELDEDEVNTIVQGLENMIDLRKELGRDLLLMEYRNMKLEFVATIPVGMYFLYIEPLAGNDRVLTADSKLVATNNIETARKVADSYLDKHRERTAAIRIVDTTTGLVVETIDVSEDEDK